MIAPLRVMPLAFAVMAIACTETESKPTAATGAPKTTSTATRAPATHSTVADADDLAALVERGRAAYNTTCTACHNRDPSLDGAIGPAIAGSPFELVEARVMRNAYPEGYVPKRDTRVMIPLPHLENELAALTAYLAQ